jgi:hypothetical protein
MDEKLTIINQCCFTGSNLPTHPSVKVNFFNKLTDVNVQIMHHPSKLVWEFDTKPLVILNP